jgi:hypothetical protein
MIARPDGPFITTNALLWLRTDMMSLHRIRSVGHTGRLDTRQSLMANESYARSIATQITR